MIKIVRADPITSGSVALVFSDGSSGTWSLAEIVARDTVMTRPLGDPAYFARAFVEAGALAWPNGLEFSADSLHRRLQESGALIRPAA